MVKPKKLSEKSFICCCHNGLLSRKEIIDHLSLRYNHKITKINPLPFKALENSILKRIESIANMQIEIQASSNQLIQVLNQNTSAMIQKLSNIINLLRKSLSIPSDYHIYEIENFDLIKNFKANPPVFTALTQHFEQIPILKRNVLFSIARNVKNQLIDIRRNHIASMQCMAVFSDEKRVVTGGTDGAIRVWNLETKSQICYILKHKAFINCLALGNLENLVITGSADTTVRLFNLKLKSQIHKFEGHSEFVSSVLFSQDQRTGFSGSYDKTIKIWNLISLTPQRTFHFLTSIQQIYLFRQDSMIAACQMFGSLSFFDFNDSNYSNTPSYHNSNIRIICFTPNEEHFITGSEDGRVGLWLTNGLERHFIQKVHYAPITSIVISTCSNFFATGSNDHTVNVWDFCKFQTIGWIKNESISAGFYFPKSSNYLLICSAFDITLFNFRTFVNKEIIKIAKVNFIAISSDLTYAAYGFLRVCLIDIKYKLKVTKSSNIEQNIIFLSFHRTVVLWLLEALEDK